MNEELASIVFCFIIKDAAIFVYKCPLCRFLYLPGSDGAVFAYFVINVFRFAYQLVKGEVGGYVQVIDIVEYLFALVAVFYLF